MGNQRQQLKSSIAETLKRKIEITQALLAQLKNEQENTEKICVQSKIQIQDAVDKITQQLARRKAALINEVNFLTQTQTYKTQTNIQNAYQVLGNLQSTLSNLDSFDNSQLLKLQIPEAVISNEEQARFSLETNCDCGQVLENMDNWGHVTVPIGNNPTVESEFVQTSPIDDAELETELLQKWLAEERKRLSPSPTPCAWQNVMDTKNWLWGKLDSDSDDFEVLMDQGVDLRLRRDSSVTVPDVDDTISFGTVPDDSSSIVCASVPEEFDRPEDIEEMSIWLKHRNSSNNSTQTEVSNPTVTAPALIPPEMFQSTKTSTVSTKSRFLDFPGLRLDPRCWLQQKPIVQFSAEIASNMGGKEIIPPTYAALPYPFWLKKC